MRDYTDFFTWYDNFLQAAWHTGNHSHQELGMIYERINQVRDQGSIQQLSSQGVELSKKLNQPYWEVYFRYVQAEIEDTYQDSLTKFIELYVDMNKPRYRDCPFMTPVFVGLLNLYVDIDPAGYATEIIEGADYVEYQLPLDANSHVRLADMRVQVWFAKRDWRRMLSAAQQLHELAEELMNERARLQAVCYLAQIYYQLGSYHLVLDVARENESRAQKFQDKASFAQLLHWRGATLARLGQLQVSRQVNTDANNLSRESSFSSELLLSHIIHHEHLEDHNICLKACSMLGERFKQEGQHFWEWEFRYRYCLTIKRMGAVDRWVFFGAFKYPFSTARKQEIRLLLILQIPYFLLVYVLFMAVGAVVSVVKKPVQQAFEDARNAAQKLKNPEPYLERLTRLEIGDFTQV